MLLTATINRTEGNDYKFTTHENNLIIMLTNWVIEVYTAMRLEGCFSTGKYGWETEGLVIKQHSL